MTKKHYDHRHIEKKWQDYWEKKETYKAEIRQERPKYYILDMFPYPSGAGLHVGHVTGYTATDILARYKRQKGFNVLHPMGWDSFGLAAEQYAVRTGAHPAETTQQNINTYRRQLKALGFSYNWEREFATSTPDYYKWTQWIFTLLYERGLAYEAESLVNYCPALGTVLANEEVDNGRSVEGGYPVQRRPLRQWILKITAYAERLIADLEGIDWPEHLKRLQINWIGRSEGVKIVFLEKKTQSPIPIFTTCPHTLFGVTFLVLSPEHPLVSSITTNECKMAVSEYKKEVAAKSDMERTELAKEKTGVWTGAYAINPASGRPIPIWVADYVLMSYGTGAVMGVPAHDERDFLFACKYDLLIQPVISPDVAAHPELILSGMSAEEMKKQVLAGKLCWIEGGIHVHSSHAGFSIDGCDTEEAKKKIVQWLISEGKGERAVNYKLRDWLFSRQRYWGEPIPILHFADGTERALDLDELPLCSPHLLDYKPSPTGESPLAKVKEWVEIIDNKTGKTARRETNTMPQWAGSCWYYLRFCDPSNQKAAWGKEAEKYWMPVDLYVGGVEHAVLHLLYARFWHKVLYDCGLVSTIEPFQTLRNQGLVTARSYQLPSGGYIATDQVREENGRYYQVGTQLELKNQMEKMSKSKLNGVTPDEMIAEYGADTLRLYEMFMGPFDKEKMWNTEAANGCKRFLNRFFDMIYSDKVCDEATPEALKLGHRLIYGVEKDIEAMQFNTAIAKMMEFLNAFTLLEKYPRDILEKVTQLLYPFAPHIAEEVWEHFGHTETISYEPFPIADARYLEDENVLYVVQVNGKVRGKWMLPKDKSEAELLAFIRTQPNIIKHVTGEITKVVYIPNKLISLVCHNA